LPDGLLEACHFFGTHFRGLVHNLTSLLDQPGPGGGKVGPLRAWGGRPRVLCPGRFGWFRLSLIGVTVFFIHQP
jgi:hypothetical protein